MLNEYFPFLIGIVTGIHAASYGAYKDSPYEGYKPRRTLREIFIAGVLGYLISVSHWGQNEKFFIIFLVIFAGTRLITEFYKLFIRTESQKIYNIPTQIHLFGKIITNKWERLFIGIIAVFIVFLIYVFGEFSLHGQQNIIKGIILGLQMGLATAIAGGYKDGFYEGFDRIKFLRSPTLGVIGGLFVSFYTSNIAFIILGAVGFERILVELYKGFLKKGYWPGKFGSGTVRHKEWMERREIFIPFYAASLLFLILLYIQSFRI